MKLCRSENPGGVYCRGLSIVREVGLAVEATVETRLCTLGTALSFQTALGDKLE